MIRKTSLWLAALSLALCLAAPVFYFLGRMDSAAYKAMLALATASWFLFATIFATHPRKG
jgi:hypothetical protein